MSENETQTQTIPDNSPVIFTKGRRKDATGTVLGFDTTTGQYAVRLGTGAIVTAPVGQLATPPEPVLTESQLVQLVRGCYDPDNHAIFVDDFLRAMENNFPGFASKLPAAH